LTPAAAAAGTQRIMKRRNYKHFLIAGNNLPVQSTL